MFVETNLTFLAAFVNGLASFFSPCVLPLIPAYFAFLAGASLDQLTEQEDRGAKKRLILSTAMFCLGFSSIFIVLGLTTSALSGLVNAYKDVLRIAGGVVVIILGLHLAGLFRIKFLDVEKRFHMTQRPAGMAGILLVGMAFGAGWTPCIGPFLASVLFMAANQETALRGGLLLAVFSAGLALPFMGLAVFVHLLLGFLKRANKLMRFLIPAGGMILVLVGVALVFNLL